MGGRVKEGGEEGGRGEEGRGETPPPSLMKPQRPSLQSCPLRGCLAWLSSQHGGVNWRLPSGFS